MAKLYLGDFTTEDVISLLPHGNGFNGDWNGTIEDGVFTGQMIYEHMSEEGMYDFNAPFTVSIPLHDAMEFSVELTGSDEQNKLAEDDDLPSYFEDTIAENLRFGYNENIIDVLLRKFDTNFSVEKGDGFKKYSLVDAGDEPWGEITVRDGKAFFIHSNDEPEISLDDLRLPTWVELYTKGFDEFAELFN